MKEVRRHIDACDKQITLTDVVRSIDVPISLHRFGLFVMYFMLDPHNLVTYKIAAVYCFTEVAHEYYRLIRSKFSKK